MAADAIDLALRIVIVDPVPGVALALQQGKTGSAALIAPSSVSADAAAFDFTVVAAAKPGPSPRLLGPFVQGPPDKRFVYVCIGVYAGDATSPWSRRAKIPLTGLTWPLIEALKAGGPPRSPHRRPRPRRQPGLRQPCPAAARMAGGVAVGSED
ncbi:MAG: DUF5990 family protein [Aliidongia sp.]